MQKLALSVKIWNRSLHSAFVLLVDRQSVLASIWLAPLLGLRHMTSFEIAFLFPGQGSQAVGMGVALAASQQPAKHVFDEVNDALNENLFEIMANGPDDLIRMTRNAQPALFADNSQYTFIVALLRYLCLGGFPT